MLKPLSLAIVLGLCAVGVCQEQKVPLQVPT